MKQSKYLLLSIILAGLSLATIVVGYTTGCKPDKHKESANSVNVKMDDSFKVRPLTNIKYEHTAQRLKQGEYLANSILMCFTCHSPRTGRLPDLRLLMIRKGVVERLSIRIAPTA